MQDYEVSPDAISHDERLWGMLAYLLAFCAPVLAPLVIYLVKKDQSRFVGFHALQILLVDVAVIALGVVAGVLGAVLQMLGGLGLLAFFLPVLPGVAGFAALVIRILGAIQAWGGQWFEVPFLGEFARKQVGA